MSLGTIQSIESGHSMPPSLSNAQDKSEPSSSGDAHWFTAAISKADTPVSDNVAERVIGSLSGSSEHLQNLSDQANRDLRKASKSADPDAISKASRSLSNFYLEALLTSKMISKGTQAVEKLTSLQ